MASSHKIADISFSAKTVICTCGWVGHGDVYELWREHIGRAAKRGIR